jgi:hypothetical protein
MEVVEPLDEFISVRSLARTINCIESPHPAIMGGREIDSYRKLVDLNNFTLKYRAIPTH